MFDAPSPISRNPANAIGATGTLSSSQESRNRNHATAEQGAMIAQARREPVPPAIARLSSQP